MTTAHPTPPAAKPIGRRDLLWLLLTSGTALFGGGALSWGLKRDEAARSAAASADALTRTLANSGGQLAALTDSLRAAEAEIGRLAGELARAQGLVAQYETEIGAKQAALTAAESERDSLRQQLTASEARAGALQGLLALLDDLDGVGLDDIVRSGLAALSSAWAAMGVVSPMLQSGISLATNLLTEFEETIADLREKVLAGVKVIDAVDLDIERIETAMGEAILTVGPLFSPIVQFVAFVVERVPLEVSRPFERAMELTRRLLLSAPQSLRNLRQALLRPIERYLGQNPAGWSAALTRPLREQLLIPASEFVAKWDEADAAFNEQVMAPTTAALDKRAQLRADIAAYKTQHGLS